MIGKVLAFLRSHLDTYLRAELEGTPDAPSGDKVVFIEGDQLEPLSFKLGAVSELLINVEEERVMRPADLYSRRNDAGEPQGIQPDIRLTLYVLFVARFKRYDAAWEHLSKIIEHFQTLRVFEQEDMPSLAPDVERLVLELVTLSFAEQNEVWNALRITHHPSILYRVRLLAFRDRAPKSKPLVTERTVETVRKAP